jgi:hypothetical protein
MERVGRATGKGPSRTGISGEGRSEQAGRRVSSKRKDEPELARKSGLLAFVGVFDGSLVYVAFRQG